MRAASICSTCGLASNAKGLLPAPGKALEDAAPDALRLRAMFANPFEPKFCQSVDAAGMLCLALGWRAAALAT
jgi:hypothetical protein